MSDKYVTWHEKMGADVHIKFDHILVNHFIGV